MIYLLFFYLEPAILSINKEMRFYACVISSRCLKNAVDNCTLKSKRIATVDAHLVIDYFDERFTFCEHSARACIHIMRSVALRNKLRKFSYDMDRILKYTPLIAYAYISEDLFSSPRYAQAFERYTLRQM